MAESPLLANPVLSALLCVVVCLVSLLVTAVVVRRARRDYLAKHHITAYRRVLRALALILCSQAAIMVGAVLYEATLPAQLNSSGYVTLLLLMFSPVFLLASFLTLKGWWLVAEFMRARSLDTSECDLQQPRRFWWLANWLANWRAAALTVGPVIVVASLAWYVPPAIWHALGRPPIKEDRYTHGGFTALEGKTGDDVIGVINGRPLTLRCDPFEDKLAKGDVRVTVTHIESKKRYSHTFGTVSDEVNHFGYWGVPLDGGVAVRVSAQLVSGPFSGTYRISAPKERKVSLVLEFFGNEPRVLLYGSDSGGPKLIRRSR